MILVDSSVLIGHLRGTPSPEQVLWEAAVRDDSGQILIGDLILLEVLQGLRDSATAVMVERELRGYQTASLLNPDLAVTAAANYRQLRDLGVTLRKTVDLIIGTFCIVHDHILLHRDRDFDVMSQHLGLRTMTAAPH